MIATRRTENSTKRTRQLAPSRPTSPIHHRHGAGHASRSRRPRYQRGNETAGNFDGADDGDETSFDTLVRRTWRRTPEASKGTATTQVMATQAGGRQYLRERKNALAKAIDALTQTPARSFEIMRASRLPGLSRVSGPGAEQSASLRENHTPTACGGPPSLKGAAAGTFRPAGGS